MITETKSDRAIAIAIAISANDELLISRNIEQSDRTPSKLPEAIENVTSLSIWGTVTYIICRQ